MGQIIHARKTEQDELRFRVYSDNCDSYISKEMTEAELREWTLKDAVCRAIEQHLRYIDESIRDAIDNGASWGDHRVLTGPWDESEETEQSDEPV